MKLQQKIIFMPIGIIMIIFMIFMLGIEYHLKELLQKRFKNELRTIAAFSLSAVDLVSYDFDVKTLDSSFDLLADRISKASKARISYFTYKGVLVGDSALTFSEVLSSKPLSDRTEITEALTNGMGIAKRFSYLTNKETIYYSIYNNQTGFIARAAMPENSFDSIIFNLRINFIFIIITTIACIVLLGIFTINLVKKSVKKERNRQENRIITRTREITFIQTMTTLLNGAELLKESSSIISNIMPKLMPSYSGAVSLLDGNQRVYELTHWGKNWPEEVSLLPSMSWLTSSSKDDSIISELCSTDGKMFCIKLINEEQCFGALHLITTGENVDVKFNESVNEIAHQISQALSNLILKERLRNQATRDPLTNLYNRRFMLETFEQSLHRAERHQGNLAVLLIDLDHFKRFNDEFGHDAGDMVLTEVAKLFQTNLRLEDIACRYGGEEFCIICPDTGLKETYLLAEKLRNRINKATLIYKNKTLSPISMSIGISVFPNHGSTTETLIAEADTALYNAKHNGRNCTVVAQSNASHQYKS